MALEPGTILGPYEVTAKIGEGGMGEVYRATDTSLDRQVAIKVLPDAFASDAERLARFEREAKVLASLNHPNIGAIYGLEKSGDTRALVLELVEGPTLADRIAQGPIAVDEALPIAKQIAEALEAAHEQGIIHRDLKPANIKVKDDGMVKVLDFGLAKAFQPDASDPNMSQSPTISLTAAATQMGMVIGTAAYMPRIYCVPGRPQPGTSYARTVTNEDLTTVILGFADRGSAGSHGVPCRICFESADTCCGRLITACYEHGRSSNGMR